MDLLKRIECLDKDVKHLFWQALGLKVLPQCEFVLGYYVISVEHVLLLREGLTVVEDEHAVVVNLGDLYGAQ